MRTLYLISWFFLVAGPLMAGTPDAPPAGILILKAVAGYDAAATSFASIQWVDQDSGYVIDPAGNKLAFLNDAIGRVIYFDQAYYDEIDHNQYWIEWRASVRSREIVLPPVQTMTLQPQDLPRLATEQALLQDAIDRYSNGRALVQPLIDALKDQSAKLSSGLVLQNGNWIPAKDAVVAASTVPVIGDAAGLVTFTTKDGKQIVNARVTATDTGVSVLTEDGGASISFDRLPDNVGAFPKAARDKITDWKIQNAKVAFAPTPPPPAPAPPPPPPPSFWSWLKTSVQGVATATWAYFSPAPASPTTPSTAAAPKPTAPLPDLANTVVLIKSDYSEGTGFLTRMASGPVVITNLHVIAGNPNVKIFTASGQEIVPLSLQAASDRDLAMFAIQDNNYKYLELADKVDQTSAVDDPAIIPGNSEGGEVTLKTDGKLVGFGPQRIEFSNPIYHGNSGGPVLDVKTGKVVAVVTGAIEMRPTDDLDRDSFANANSAIKGPMRYFGLRLDTVPVWEPYDQAQFVQETLFLKTFHDESRALDSYLNGARNMGATAQTEDSAPDAKFYLTNEKLRKVDQDWQTSNQEQGRTNALQELVWNLGSVAGADLASVQAPSNYYPYDRQRAKYELAYRQALINEIQTLQTQVNQAGASSAMHTGN